MKTRETTVSNQNKYENLLRIFIIYILKEILIITEIYWMFAISQGLE